MVLGAARPSGPNPRARTHPAILNQFPEIVAVTVREDFLMGRRGLEGKRRRDYGQKG
jgi:hypothetical protein